MPRRCSRSWIPSRRDWPRWKPARNSRVGLAPPLSCEACNDNVDPSPHSREGDGQVKIAFTTSGQGLDAPLDSRFGRAARVPIYDLDSETVELIDNEQRPHAAPGAGIQA